jgi:hypothetical protein
MIQVLSMAAQIALALVARPFLALRERTHRPKLGDEGYAAARNLSRSIH